MDLQKLYQQLKEIRDSGQCNMFDLRCVLAVAEKRGFVELIDYLSDPKNHEKYVRFIFSGRIEDL